MDPLISQYSKEGLLNIHYSDLLDSASLSSLINNIDPNEVYNLAAQSHVSVSFLNPILTTQVGTLGSISILEGLRHLKKDVKFYQASSSEMFGNSKSNKQSEKTKFNPISPYGASKLFAHFLTKIYRESFKLYAVSGILFNHESPLRNEKYVTSKIIRGLINIKNIRISWRWHLNLFNFSFLLSIFEDYFTITSIHWVHWI